MSRLSAENKELITAAVRDKAFEAACAILRDEGLSEFTMENLASHMGVSKGTIYNYFRNREAVILFVMENEIMKFDELVRSHRAEQPETIQFLNDFATSSIRYFRDFRFLRVAIGEVVGKYPLSQVKKGLRLGRVHVAGRRVIDLLAEVMARGMEEGVLRRGDPDLLASVFFETLMAVTVNPHIDIDRPEVQRTFADLLLNGLKNTSVLAS